MAVYQRKADKQKQRNAAFSTGQPKPPVQEEGRMQGHHITVGETFAEVSTDRFNAMGKSMRLGVAKYEHETCYICDGIEVLIHDKVANKTYASVDLINKLSQKVI